MCRQAHRRAQHNAERNNALCGVISECHGADMEHGGGGAGRCGCGDGEETDVEWMRTMTGLRLGRCEAKRTTLVAGELKQNSVTGRVGLSWGCSRCSCVCRGTLSLHQAIAINRTLT